MANDFLSGKITFEDFINQVEKSDESEVSSDVSSSEEFSDDDDEDYIPDEQTVSVTTRKPIDESKEKVQSTLT